jgi:hypothetical protein
MNLKKIDEAPQSIPQDRAAVEVAQMGAGEREFLGQFTPFLLGHTHFHPLHHMVRPSSARLLTKRNAFEF